MNADDKHSNRSSSIIIIDADDDDDDGRNNRSKKQTPSDNQQLPASFYIDQDDLVEEITRLWSWNKNKTNEQKKPENLKYSEKKWTKKKQQQLPFVFVMNVLFFILKIDDNENSVTN